MTTALKLQAGRQTSRWAFVDIVLANLTTAVDVPVMELPAGSTVIGGFIMPTEVFNSTTSDVLDVGDAGSENRYKNDADLQALTRVALVPTGFLNTAKTNITVRWVSGGGSPTTGKVTLWVEYVQRGLSDVGPQG